MKPLSLVNIVRMHCRFASRTHLWLRCGGVVVCFPAQVRQMVLSCPAILAEKPLELQRKVDFLKQVCVGV